MAIGEICNREVAIVTRDTPIAAAARLYHVGDHGVIEEVRGGDDRSALSPIATSSSRWGHGRARRWPHGGRHHERRGRHVRESKGVYETLRYMRDKGVRQLPVVDPAGWLQGIVTLDDFLLLLAEERSAMAKLVAREIDREQVPRK